MGRGPNLSLQQVERIAKLARLKMTDQEIANEVGCSRGAVQNKRAQLGIVTKSKPGPKRGARPPRSKAEPSASVPSVVTAVVETPIHFAGDQPIARTVDVTIPLPIPVLQRVAHKVKNGEGIAACAARLLGEAVMTGRAA